MKFAPKPIPRLSYENTLVLILGLTFGVVFFERLNALFLMFLIKPDLGMSNAQAGMVASALIIGWSISAYYVALMSDRSGNRKGILLICILAFSLCSVFSGLSRSFWELLISRFLMGLAEGGVLPICFALIKPESSPKRLGLNMGIVQGVAPNIIAAVIGPIVSIALALALSWRYSLYLSALPGLLCIPLIWFWINNPKKLETENKTSKMGLFQMLRIRNIFLCSLISVFMMAWIGIFPVFYPLYFIKIRLVDPNTTSLLMALLGVGGILSNFLLPSLSDHLGRKRILLAGILISILTPLTAIYFHGPIWMLGFLTLLGCFCLGTFPLFLAIIPGESVPARYVASAMGLIVALGEIIGGIGGPLLAGWLSDKTALVASIWLLLIFPFFAFIVACFLKESYFSSAV